MQAIVQQQLVLQREIQRQIAVLVHVEVTIHLQPVGQQTIQADKCVLPVLTVWRVKPQAACPDRKVICLEGDGAAMYTIQALWTMAREELDVCTIIFSNRKYQILQVELARVGAQSMNKKTLDMMDLANPKLHFVALAEGMGVSASAATTADEFNQQFVQAMQTRGPHLIEVILDSDVSGFG